MQRNAIARAISSACLLMSLAHEANAAGFALHEQGISGLGNAYAGAAAVATRSFRTVVDAAGKANVPLVYRGATVGAS